MSRIRSIRTTKPFTGQRMPASRKDTATAHSGSIRPAPAAKLLCSCGGWQGNQPAGRETSAKECGFQPVQGCAKEPRPLQGDPLGCSEGNHKGVWRWNFRNQQGMYAWSDYDFHMAFQGSAESKGGSEISVQRRTQEPRLLQGDSVGLAEQGHERVQRRYIRHQQELYAWSDCDIPIQDQIISTARGLFL